MPSINVFMASKTDEEKAQFIKDYENFLSGAKSVLQSQIRAAALEYQDTIGYAGGHGGVSTIEVIESIAFESYKHFAKIELARREEPQAAKYTHRISWKEEVPGIGIVTKSFGTTEDAVSMHVEAITKNGKFFSVSIERL